MQEKIRAEIISFIANYPHAGETGWFEPLTAFAAAGDPLFARLKDLASPTHCLPADFLEEAETVITYFLPFHREVVESNIKGRYSSKTWGLSYIETNKAIAALNEHLQKYLVELGFKTVYVPATHNFDERTLLSDWSHRSAAYIAGLGTFGLNHMLITEKGCCGRIGSLITDLKIAPTARPQLEYCLYKANGSCGRCVKKCVNHALHFDLLDKHKCYEMCLINSDRLKKLESIADVCGKCLVGVPCSQKIPRDEKAL